MAKPIALAGIGKIAHEEHIPALKASRHWDLAATISRSAGVEGVAGYHDMDDFLAGDHGIETVSLALPPGPRFDYAVKAMEAGLNVMLEKPPARSLTECRRLCRIAEDNGVTLFLSWHARMGGAVEEARRRLAGQRIKSLKLEWVEDVRKTHTGQEWVWKPGNLGVFDPGINATSILCAILDDAPWPAEVEMEFPEGRGTPIASDVTFGHPHGGDCSMHLDWRHDGDPVWTLRVETEETALELEGSGDILKVDGEGVVTEDHAEYEALYDHFGALVDGGTSETDLRPLEMVADCFLLARIRMGAPFAW